MGMAGQASFNPVVANLSAHNASYDNQLQSSLPQIDRSAQGRRSLNMSGRKGKNISARP
jgi:hypothetical protein